MTFLISVIIRTTFEIFDFIQKNDDSYFSNSFVAFIVHNIVSKQFRSSSLTIFNRSRSINISYSFEWIIDKSKFRQNVKRFVINIETYKNSWLFLDFLSVNVTSIISKTFISIQVIFVENNETRIEFDVSFFTFSYHQNNIASTISLTFQDIVNIDFTSNSNMIEKENYQNFDFNRQQYETLQIFLVDVKNHAQFKFSNFSKFVESFYLFDDFENSRWNSNEMNFFDSMYDDKLLIIDNSIEHANKNTYFKNIHLFTERIKNMIIIKKAKLTRQNLYTCLREFVLTWYIDVFNDDQKKLMKLNDEIEEWERTLLKRSQKIIDHNYDDDNQRKIYYEECSQTQKTLRIRSNHCSKN